MRWTEGGGGKPATRVDVTISVHFPVLAGLVLVQGFTLPEVRVPRAIMEF